MKSKEKFDFYYGNTSNDIILKPSDLKKMPMSSMTLGDQSSIGGSHSHHHIVEPPTMPTDKPLIDTD
jgi:hypothetical protein